MKGVLNPEKIRSNGIAERVREFKVIEKREVERWKTRESDEHRKKKKRTQRWRPIEKVENIAKYSTTSIFSLQLYILDKNQLENNTENKE